jgi:hypothetical protein
LPIAVTLAGGDAIRMMHGLQVSAESVSIDKWR